MHSSFCTSLAGRDFGNPQKFQHRKNKAVNHMIPRARAVCFGPSPTKICGQSRRKERVAANKNGLEDAIGTHPVIIVFELWHENEKKELKMR